MISKVTLEAWRGQTRVMLSNADSDAALVRTFSWQVPARYNIGVDVCDRWAAREPDRIALTFVGADNQARDYSYVESRCPRDHKI